jgi:hypothetical protein
MELAQKHFQKVLALEAPEDLRVLARDGGERDCVPRAQDQRSRWAAVFYLLDAIRLFRGKSLRQSF